METPTYMRYAFAAMDSAGALEEKATESFYYVTPVEPHWTKVQQEEWLSNFNYDTLRIISIHEVYPGHFVHHLHNKYGRALPLVNRVATSYAFTRGLGPLCRRNGLANRVRRRPAKSSVDPIVGSLVSATAATYAPSRCIPRKCRWTRPRTSSWKTPICGASGPAGGVAGNLRSGYLNYTLGKLMIMKLATDLQREQGAAYSLKGFHDELLSYGAPPLPLLREVMLTTPGDSPL